MPGFDPAYMLDQSHNVTDPIESIMTSAVEVTRAYAQALLVDRAALAEAQDRCDAIAALAILKRAFTTDVSPMLATARARVWWRDRSDGGLPRQRLPAAQEHRAAGPIRRRRRHRVSAGAALYVAVDLGAGSGRVFTGRASRPAASSSTRSLDSAIPPRELSGHLRWDFSAILREIRERPRRRGSSAPARHAASDGQSLASTAGAWTTASSIRDGRLLEDPISYRDVRSRTHAARLRASAAR